MSANTGIEWTDATWSPLRVRVRKDAAQIAEQKSYTSLIQIAAKMAGHVGPHCEHVSHACDHCYAETNNHRCLPANGTGLPFDRRSRDLVEPFVDEDILTHPFRWKTPRKIFVANQTDLFGDWWTYEQIDRVFQAMALCPQHTFQVLTKRPERMRKYLTELRGAGWTQGHIADAFGRPGRFFPRLFKTLPLNSFERMPWPLPNVQLGVSVESNEHHARIWELVKTPAALRFISYEPALGPLDLDKWEAVYEHWRKGASIGTYLDWVIAGGESGPGARPAHPDWFRTIRDQCKAAGVPFFFKQWGEFQLGSKEFGGPNDYIVLNDGRFCRESDLEQFQKLNPDARNNWAAMQPNAMAKLGKKHSGAMLDGREWREIPQRGGDHAVS